MTTKSNRIAGLALALVVLSGTATVTGGIFMPTPAKAGLLGDLGSVVTSWPGSVMDGVAITGYNIRKNARGVKNFFNPPDPVFVPDSESSNNNTGGGERVPVGKTKTGATNIGTPVNRSNERVTVGKKTPGAQLPPRRVSNQAPDRNTVGNQIGGKSSKIGNVQIRDKRLGISINDIKPSQKLTRDRKVNRLTKGDRLDRRSLHKFDRRMKFKNQFRSDRRTKLRIGNKRGSFKQFRQFRSDRQNFRMGHRSRR